jgi:hypothetical protein
MMGKTAVTFAIACLPLATLTLIPRVADAQSMSQSAPPSGVLSLSADQSIDVPEDVIRITLFHEQEGSDPTSLTKALKERAAEALGQARGGDSKVTVQTGAFTVYPSTDRDGKISAWRGRTEAILESTDFEAASKLAGKLAGTMQIARRAPRCRAETDGARDCDVPSAGAGGHAGVRLCELHDSRSTHQPSRRNRAAAGHDARDGSRRAQHRAGAD